MRLRSGAWVTCSALCAAIAMSAFFDAAMAGEKDGPSSVYVIELGGYGVFSPTYEGSKSYNLGFKPIIDFHEAGDRVWFSTPDDSFTIDLFETRNFRVGLAGDISLQSRTHNENLDLRLGKTDVVLLGGVFAEYYPIESIRTRVEVLQAVTGYSGMSVNFAADYIWKPTDAWTLSLGPRLQVVDDEYASSLFSTRAAKINGVFAKYRAEGGVHSVGAQLTGEYDWTQKISTKFFVKYDELVGDAADSPRVDVRGNASQVSVGVGASYKLSVER